MMENGYRKAGVIGVGSMGSHHARVYSELPMIELVGVADADPDRARAIADRHRTRACAWDVLLDAVDLVSIAVPTQYHYEIARACIERGVHVLIEKPFVVERKEGETLRDLAAERDITIQVDHVERFNPAVDAVREVLDGQGVIAIDAQRLSPPLDRAIDDTAVFDLIIHDIDVLFSLVGSDPVTINALGTHENRYIDARMQFANGIVASLTANRLTQEKIRELSITAAECWVTVDYIPQSVDVHRRSLPEYIKKRRVALPPQRDRRTTDGRECRSLRRELESFVATARDGMSPVVSADDGLRALGVARRVDELAANGQPKSTHERRRTSKQVKSRANIAVR